MVMLAKGNRSQQVTDACKAALDAGGAPRVAHTGRW